MVYNIHFTFEKVHKKFTVFHKRNITSSQVTHLKNYLGWQNNRRATEEENGWNPPFIKFLPPHLRTPSPKRMPRAHAQHQWTLGAHQTPLPPNRPVRATPSPKRMLRAHAQLEWTLGAHQPPPPKRPVRAPPSPTDRYEQPLPPKGCWERMRNLSGRWGRIRPPSPPTDRYEQPLPPYPHLPIPIPI